MTKTPSIPFVRFWTKQLAPWCLAGVVTYNGIISSSAVEAATVTPAAKLNVILILVDDLRPALGCFGDKQARSPAIDSLATRGLCFSRAYAQSAYSTPSRISMMTGIRPNALSLADPAAAKNTLFPEAKSLPMLFKTAGYEAIGMGRVYMSNKDDADSWSSPVWQPSGTWVGRGYLEADNKAIATAPDNKDGRGPAFEIATSPDAVYPDQVLADHAIKELQRLQASSFFMTIGFRGPHLPLASPKSYWDLHQNLQYQTRNTWPTGMPEIAGHNSSELRNYVGIPATGAVNDELNRTLARGYYASVSYVDAQVGRILAELDRLQLTSNTIVVLSGDHGFKIGDYGAWNKFTGHDIDLHTPLMMMGPGIPVNTVSPALVELVDIVPTLAALCGIPAPTTNQGQSLKPLFSDSGIAWKKAVYSLTPRGAVIGYSMRTDRWRYTEWVTGDLNQGSNQVMSYELYDHQIRTIVDRNLADLPENRDLMKLLGQQLRCGWKHSK